MKRQQRLRRTADFQRVRTQAPRGWHDPLLSLYAAPADQAGSRLGVVVSKRVAREAVIRNRVRRRVRESARLAWPSLRPGYDVVFVARPASARASWTDLRASVEALLGRARVLVPPPVPPQSRAPALAERG